jgi:hypothetical protein
MNIIQELIIEAIDNKDIKELKVLIKENPDVKLDFDSQSPIFSAGFSGNFEIFKYLYSFKEININYMCYHSIATQNNFKILKFLFDKKEIKLRKDIDLNLIGLVFKNKAYKVALYLYQMEFYQKNLDYIKKIEPKLVQELEKFKKLKDF